MAYKYPKFQAFKFSYFFLLLTWVFSHPFPVSKLDSYLKRTFFHVHHIKLSISLFTLRIYSFYQHQFLLEANQKVRETRNRKNWHVNQKDFLKGRLFVIVCFIRSIWLYYNNTTVLLTRARALLLSFNI